MQPRIAPLEAPFTPETAELLRKLMPPKSGVEPLSLFRTLAHHLELSNRMHPLASGILAHGAISPIAREIVILRVCARCGAEYEWGVHVTFFGERVGLSNEKLIATFQSDGEDIIWSEGESLLMQMVDELHDTAHISDGLWEGLVRFWNPAQIIELLTIAGWYHAIAYVCNACCVPLEMWAARFPVKSEGNVPSGV